MKIGDLSRRTGTPVQTIRFYERAGLLAATARAGNNYRVYSEDHAELLAFIRRCRGLDMALEEIRVLLALRSAGGAHDCGPINALLDEHIGHLEMRVRELRALQTQLEAIRAHCSAPGAVDDCGALKQLERLEPATRVQTESRHHIDGSHRAGRPAASR
jgi:Cd(II)/Pb(II)-responsive transcriptional regulator